MSNENAVKPWYRQFWCWFVFTPLIVIVMVCSVFVTIAVKHSDDVVIDNYYKEGRMINQVFDQDRRARVLNLQANVDFSLEAGQVNISIANAQAIPTLPAKILLVLSHPAKQDMDQHVILSSTAPGEYVGELDHKPDNHWYVLAYATDSFATRDQAEWIIAGQIDFSQRHRLTLNPRQ